MSQARLIADVRNSIAQVTAVEQALGRKLSAQQEALTADDPAGLVARNADLDQEVARLQEVGLQLRAATDDLAAALGLPAGSRLGDVVRAIPDPSAAAELTTARDLLVRVRREVRAASARNATLARASLDAIATVRGILSRAATGDTAPATSPMSLLDAKA